MSTIKIVKTKDFTVMSNHHLRDRNLSLKAKGAMTYPIGDKCLKDIINDMKIIDRSF